MEDDGMSLWQRRQRHYTDVKGQYPRSMRTGRIYGPCGPALTLHAMSLSVTFDAVASSSTSAGNHPSLPAVFHYAEPNRPEDESLFTYLLRTIRLQYSFTQSCFQSPRRTSSSLI